LGPAIHAGIRTWWHARIRPLGKPEWQLSLLAPFRRNVVVAAVSTDLLPRCQREEFAVPSLLLDVVEHPCHDCGSLLSVERRRRVPLPHDFGVVVAPRCRGVVAATRPQHAPGLADCDHRVVDVVQAPEVRHVGEHAIGKRKCSHVGENHGSVRVRPQLCGDESTPIQLTPVLTSDASRPSPQPTSRTGPRSAGASSRAHPAEPPRPASARGRSRNPGEPLSSDQIVALRLSAGGPSPVASPAHNDAARDRQIRRGVASPIGTTANARTRRHLCSRRGHTARTRAGRAGCIAGGSRRLDWCASRIHRTRWKRPRRHNDICGQAAQASSSQQRSPCDASRPSLIASAAMTSAATGSAHHQPTVALSRSPTRSTAER
jgi:hypothetical protein